MPLDKNEVKQLAIVIQTLKPRRKSNNIEYLEALHTWRHGRVTVIRNLIPDQYKKLFNAECPVPKERYTSRKPGPKVAKSKAPVTLYRVAGFDPEEQPFRWTRDDAEQEPAEA